MIGTINIPKIKSHSITAKLGEIYSIYDIERKLISIGVVTTVAIDRMILAYFAGSFGYDEIKILNDPTYIVRKLGTYKDMVINEV